MELVLTKTKEILLERYANVDVIFPANILEDDFPVEEGAASSSNEEEERMEEGVTNKEPNTADTAPATEAATAPKRSRGKRNLARNCR